MATVYVQDSADFNAGGAPAVGDTVIVTGKKTGNATAVTTNVDKSTLGAGGIANIKITRNMKANIGSYTSPLKSEISAQLVNDADAGSELFYTADGTANTCAKLRHLGLGATRLVGTGTFAITNLEQRRGEVLVGKDHEPTTIRGAGGYMHVDDDTGVSPTTVYAGGDFVLRLNRGIAAGGNLYIFDNARVILDCGTDTVPTIWMFGGSLEIVQCGTITTFHLLGGDANRISIGREITITTLNAWPTVRNVKNFIDNPFLTITTKNLDIEP